MVTGIARETWEAGRPAGWRSVTGELNQTACELCGLQGLPHFHTY